MACLQVERSSIVGGGTKHRFTISGEIVALAVQLPGTLCRIYWQDGTTSDVASLEAARLMVEAGDVYGMLRVKS